jgi:hypothetical protein
MVIEMLKRNLIELKICDPLIDLRKKFLICLNAFIKFGTNSQNDKYSYKSITNQ